MFDGADSDEVLMSSHPVLHVLHNVGVATWFGGSLMGATGLNAAAAQLDDPRQRSTASTAGWSRWAPVNAAGVGAHMIGAVGLLITERDRVRNQDGVGRSSAIKTAATAAALGTAGWSFLLNRKMAAAGPVPVEGATEASASTPPDVAKTLKQLKLVQWLNPLASGAIILVTSWQEEQMRAGQVAPGLVKNLTSRVPGGLPVIAAAGTLAVLATRKKGSSQTVDAYPPPPVVQRPAPINAHQTASATGSTDGHGTASSTTMPPA